jgi:hypothetical protein
MMRKKVIRKNISCHWKNKLIHFIKQHLENMEMSGKTITQPKLLDKVRNEMRAGHYSPRREESYTNWIKRFIL